MRKAERLPPKLHKASLRGVRCEIESRKDLAIDTWDGEPQVDEKEVAWEDFEDKWLESTMDESRDGTTGQVLESDNGETREDGFSWRCCTCGHSRQCTQRNESLVDDCLDVAG